MPSAAPLPNFHPSVPWRSLLKIPARYAPILFRAILSALMVTIVSAFVIATTQGLQPGFLSQWAKSCATTWPIAFVSVTLIAPVVRRIVARITA